MTITITAFEKSSDGLARCGSFAAYVVRGETGPAHKHAFDAQWDINQLQ